MIVVVVIFGICWLPQNIYLVLQNVTSMEYEYIQHIYIAIYWLAMSNSMYNPIIYCWMNERYVIIIVKLNSFVSKQAGYEIIVYK